MYPNAGHRAHIKVRTPTSDALAEVERLLAQSLDPQVVGRRIAEGALTLLKAQSAALFRLDPASGALVASATSGEFRRVFGEDVTCPKGTGAVGLAVQERRPIVTQDALAHAGIALPPSVLAEPLLYHDRLLGVILLDKQGEGRRLPDLSGRVQAVTVSIPLGHAGDRGGTP